MKVGDLVKAPDISWNLKLGLVMEAESDDDDTAGHWVEFLDDSDNWRWFSHSDVACMVKVISESR
jgi:hypothetical protein